MRGTKVQKANKRGAPRYARNLYQAEARIEKLEAKLAEARQLLQTGIRYAWNCEGDPSQPPSFRARAEVWMADVQYLIGND